MSDLYSYSPEDVSITLAGIFNVEGVVADTFVTITRVLPVFETKLTADGQAVRTLRTDATYDLELTLMQGSKTNEVLTLLHYIDQASGRGKFPIVLKDGSGTSTFYSASCWVQETPVTSFSGTDASSRTWRIRCADATLFVGADISDSYVSGDVGAILGALAALV